MGSLARVSTRIASTALRGYLRAIGPSLRVAFSFANGFAYEGDDPNIDRFFEEQRQDGPVIYALWISDHVSLLSIGFVSSFHQRLAQQFAFVADDSFGGLVMQSALTSLGARILRVSVQDPAARLRSLRSVMQERRSIFLAVDGHGPYFNASPGLVSLAKSIRAAVVPFAAVTLPAIPITNLKVSVAVPLPRSRILATFGDPIRFQASPLNVGAAELGQIVTESLQAVHQRAQAVLQDGWPS